jgi:hypothetical protein
MKMILNVSDPHGAVLYPVYAYIEAGTEYLKLLNKRKADFDAACKKDPDLQLMAFSDYMPNFWAGDLPKHLEVDLSECDSVRDDSFQVERVFKDAELISVHDCMLKLNSDRVYWSAIVKHTSVDIWTATINFWEL